jgi:hypothetical protein
MELGVLIMNLNDNYLTDVFFGDSRAIKLTYVPDICLVLNQLNLKPQQKDNNIS